MDLIESQTLFTSDSKRHPWELARYELAEKEILKHFDFDPKDTLLIDLGCGDAFTLSKLKDTLNVDESKGLDIGLRTDQIAQLENNYSSISFFNNSDLFWKSVGESSKKNLLILLMDVIEHIEDEESWLKTINDKIRKLRNVQILITVPAGQRLFSEHDRLLGHFRRYNKNNLRLVIDHSLSIPVVSSGAWFLVLMIPRTISLLQERFFGKKMDKLAPLIWTKGSFSQHIVKWTLLLLEVPAKCLDFFGIKSSGLSLYLSLKK